MKLKNIKKSNKKYAVLALSLTGLMMLSGCSPADLSGLLSSGKAQKEETLPQENKENEEANHTPETTAASGKYIQPLDSGIDLSNLTDAIVHIGFTEKTDIYRDEEGKAMIRMDVYSDELFDVVDVHMLEAGDTIRIGGKDIKVAAREEDEAGIQIRGEDGGSYTLAPNEGGTYVVAGDDDYRDYYMAGTVTLPVGEDFQLTDSSDLNKGEQVLQFADLLAQAPESDEVFRPENTTARIENGSVVEISRVYMP